MALNLQDKKALVAQTKKCVSIDTHKLAVAQQALELGASIVNDIRGNRTDCEMYGLAARTGAGYVLMHMKGTPQNMNQMADYDNVFDEVFDYFTNKYHQLKQLGVKDVILDPGFGFAKKTEHSYALMNRLQDFGG